LDENVNETDVVS